MDPVAKLLAIEEIKQLKAEYFWTVDRKDWEGNARVFTDDAVFDMTAEMTHHQGQSSGAVTESIVIGGPAIAAYIANAVGDSVSVHHGHTPVIEITGPDTATGRWMLFDLLDFGDRQMTGYGWYEEEYRRVDGRWLISRLDLLRFREDWTES